MVGMSLVMNQKGHSDTISDIIWAVAWIEKNPHRNPQLELSICRQIRTPYLLNTRRNATLRSCCWTKYRKDPFITEKNFRNLITNVNVIQNYAKSDDSNTDSCTSLQQTGKSMFVSYEAQPFATRRQQKACKAERRR